MQPDAELRAALQRLPKVDEVLERPLVRTLLQRTPRWAVVEAVRAEIERLRGELRADPHSAVELDEQRLATVIESLLQPSLDRVLNATGVVLHTGLGRAPLCQQAIARIAETAAAYCNLELDVDERRRGSRHQHVTHLLLRLTGAEAALVVNNGAGAVLLALAAHAAGREVIVSRGELVEIGGGFRVPDVMRTSGAVLCEVGTTNRTHVADYESAISDKTAALFKVHRSNFAQIGFTADVEVKKLVELGRARSLQTIVDLGSGLLTEDLGLEGVTEPTVQQVVEAGADLITFSGDKLLGGPQAGILVGSKQAMAACERHPLLRALRPDKLTIAALEATLELYRDGNFAEIPTLRMLRTNEKELHARAVALHALCTAARSDVQFSIERVRSAVGGGALPLCEPWSWAVGACKKTAGPELLDARLRAADPPVVGRIADDKLLLDVRTLTDEELPQVAQAFREG